MTALEVNVTNEREKIVFLINTGFCILLVYTNYKP